MSDKPTNIKDVVDLDKVVADQAALTKKQDKLDGLMSTLNEEVHKWQDHSITKEEFATRLDKIVADVATFQNEMQATKNAIQVVQSRPVFTDFRHMLKGVDYLVHENGQRFNDVEEEAYCLFQMPVNYEKMEYGEELKNLRNLHDAILIINAWKSFKNQGSGRYKIENLKTWKTFTDAVKPFSDKIAHAMATGNTGFGAEWVPVEFSNEFNELLRVTPNLASRFPTWIMSSGSTGYFPFQESAARVYRAAEATVDNAPQLRKTNAGTSRHLFTPHIFAGALLSSVELTEDALIDQVGFIRMELATALLEGLDSAIINGDSTSPHQDNDEQTVYETWDVETYFKGLRRIAVDDTKTVNIETIAGDTGVGALKMMCLAQLQDMLGIAGTRAEQCIWVTGQRGRSAIVEALLQASAVPQMWDFFVSGSIPNLLGSPLVVSGKYLETLESDGLDGTDADHTSLCYAHTRSFRVAQRRGVTLEYSKDIFTQQEQFVGTLRADFGKVCSSTTDPVVCGINIEHT